MSFLHPEILFGLLAVSAPLAIHLLNKLRVRETQWAAMRFLEETARRVQRKLRWEDLLLLLLRCLIFAALAIAFARPVKRSLSGLGSTNGGPVAAVVLLDNSASMGQSDGMETRFDAAKKAARAFADGLPTGSTLALSLVSNRAEALIPKPTGDLALFRHALEQATPSNRGSDLATGMRAAMQTLKPLTGHPREIVIFTDSQTTAWNHLDEIRTLQSEAPDIPIKPVILGAHGEDNLGVTALQADGNITALNQPSRFRVDVANYGTHAAQGVRVTLCADDGPPSDETVIPKIEPGETHSISLFARFGTPGDHAVTARIPPDRLAADNERSTVVSVASQRSALIVEGRAALREMDRDGFFLANALAPVSRDRIAQYYLKVTAAPAGAVTKEKLAAHDFAFLCNPGDLTAKQAEMYRDYTRDGGRLIIFPGPATDVRKWTANPVLAELMPAQWHPAPAVSQPLAWQKGDYQHPVTALWNDPAQGSLGGVRFQTYLPLTLPAAAGNPQNEPSVLVRYSNGEPAVVEKAVGKGRVVLFGSTATPQWNNFPLHPAFVPFIQRLLGYLDPRRGARTVLNPGERFEAAVPMEFIGRDFSVIPPGKEAKKRVAGKVELVGGVAGIRFSDTEFPGVYQLVSGDTPLTSFAVQLPAAESDLRQMDRATLTALEQAPKGTQDLAANGGKNSTSTKPQGAVTREYWTQIIWFMAALVLAEMLLAQFLGMRMGAKKS